MRLLALLALLTFYPYAPAAAGDDGFSGVWTALLCPSGMQSDSGKCSNFVLELFQKENRLCGTHVFATAGASRLDQGAAPSLLGDIVDGAATAVVVSGRASPPVRVRVELKMERGLLQWKRLENPKGDYLLPLTAQLTRSKRKTLLKPMFAHELKAACSSVPSPAVESSAPPAAPPAR